MKKEIKSILVILLLLIIGTISVIYYNLYIQNNKIKKIKTAISEIIEKTEENIYQIGNIVIDKNKEELYFTGRVAKIKGWIQFLIYVDGYKWLEDEAAIISDVRLKDLQLSLAFLDWEYWDEFYYKKRGGELDLNTKELKLELFLQWKENNKLKIIPVSKAIIIKDTQVLIELPHLIFLGNPIFDRIVLGGESAIFCQGCPLFPAEEKALRKLFERKSLESGYEINSEIIPPLNTKIDIVIKKLNFLKDQK